MIKHICKTCQYAAIWEQKGGQVIECHRYAPRAFDISRDGTYYPFPRLPFSSDWCGEWKAKGGVK